MKKTHKKSRKNLVQSRAKNNLKVPIPVIGGKIGYMLTRHKMMKKRKEIKS
jgi:hypothetical protein